MDLQNALFTLSRCAGPSGAEEGVFDAARALLEPFVDRIDRDALGNLIGRRAAAVPEAETLLLAAHLDEVGMVVTGWEDGFLRFLSCGIDERMLPALEVRVCTDPPLPGVVTCLPPHVLSEEERRKAFPPERLRIDCGLTQEEARELVPVGTRVVYSTEPFALGEKRLCGKAFDDRACFVVLCRVMELLKDEPLAVNLCVLGTVQEEETGAGAITGTYALAPDRAIVADVSFGRAPDTEPEDTAPLGSGPMIGVGPYQCRAMTRELMALARQQDIPFTREVMPRSTGTDADEIQISRSGVAVANVSLPLRYMHTPLEVVDLEDMEACARLIAAYIRARKEASPC